MTFRYRFRVHYHECDAQKIVFNARWGEYVDIATTEYGRVLFGGVDPASSGLDWRLVRQVTEWKAPGRFDDVIEARVSTLKVGTTSFTLATELWRDHTLLVKVETVYVVVDPEAGTKMPVPERHRAALERGTDVVVDRSR